MVKLTAGPIDEHPFWGPAQFSGAFAAGFTPHMKGAKNPRRRPHHPAPIFSSIESAAPKKTSTILKL